MPFELAWEPRGVVVTYSGLLVADEILECHRRIAADLRFDDLRFAIVDTLPVRSVSLSREDVEQIDAFLQGPAVTNANIRVAFAATHPDVLRALSFYGSLADRAFQEVVCASVPAARRAIRTAGSDPATPAAPRP